MLVSLSTKSRTALVVSGAARRPPPILECKSLTGVAKSTRVQSQPFPSGLNLKLGQ